MSALPGVLLEASVRAGVVGIAVFGAVQLFRVRSSSLRHKAWLAVLVAMLLMPVLPRIVPRLDLPTRAAAPRAAELAAPGGESGGSMVPESRLVESLPAAREARAKPSNPVRLDWMDAAAGVYALGVLILLGRLVAGWLCARRLLAQSCPAQARGMKVHESERIVTPFTVGLRSPQILLPLGWREWPEGKLAAVLAHEAAHVRRRDTFTSFLAHVNRAMFWFHPLAWWLQRQLALDAEKTCDDAAVAEVGEIRGYTAVLLEMAETASRRGGSFAFHGTGVDGAGLLGPRIDRLLREGSSVGATNTQRIALAGLSGVAIFLSSACQQKALPELKADPAFAQQIAGSVARNISYQETNRMTAADAEALQAKVFQDFENKQDREKLMQFYQSRGREVLGDEKATKGFWTVKLWCVAHHPEDTCAIMSEPLFDRASYEKGAKLWEGILRRPDLTPDMQVNATWYFYRNDPKRAEEIAMGARVDEQKRRRLLSGIYTAALRNPAAPTPYTEDLRKRLEESKDAALLSMTGMGLIRMQPLDSAASILGHKLIERAAMLDGKSVDRNELARVEKVQAGFQSAESYRRMLEAVGREVSEAQYQKFSALPAEQRAQFLPALAEQAYWAGANLTDYNHDPAGARRDWEIARKYAKDALTAEEGFRSDPDYYNRIYKANIILSMLAFRADQSHQETRQYLLAAAKIPRTDNWFPATLKLLVLMLRYGNADDRAAVIEFCEVHGKVAQTGGVDLLQSAKKLREGVMPTWYQYEVAQFKR